MIEPEHQRVLKIKLDHEFKIQHSSQSFAAFIGRSASALEGIVFWDLIAADYPQELVANVAQNVAMGLTWMGEMPFSSFTQEVLWADVNLVQIDGIVHFIGIEITEQKRIYLRIKENYRFQETLMNEAPVGILISSGVSSCEYVNLKWLELTGLTKLQTLGDGWLRAIHPEDRERVQEHWRLAFTGNIDPIEYRYLRPDSKVVTVLARCRLVQHSQILRIENDLTEIRDQQKIIEEQNRKIFEDRKLVALGTVSAGIAHEINNPLAIALGFFDELSSLESHQAERTQYLKERITKSLKRIERIVVSTKSLSSQTAHLKLDQIDFSELRKEILSDFQMMTQDKEVQLVWDETLPMTMLGSHSELLQVFSNVLLNAKQAVAKSPKKVITVTTRVQSSYLEIRCTDSGNGIPEDIRQYVFDPFFTTKDPGAGTGLGLSISKKIMLRMKGDLVLEKCYPATFCIKILLTTDKELR